MRKRLHRVAGLGLGCLMMQLSGLSAASDTVSRELFARHSLQEPDAVARELFLRHNLQQPDAITRELVWMRSDSERDISSRELVLYRSSTSNSVVSREYSVGFVAQVHVVDGFLIREYASIPTGPAEWMSLAANPGDDNQQNDLLVASTTRQFGEPNDVPDDFLHRVQYGSLDVAQVAALASCDSDPADLAFSPDGALYVAARHRDGFLPGDQGGAILSFDRDGVESSFFDDRVAAHGPLALAQAPLGSQFNAGLYVGNELPNAPSVFQLDDAGNLQAFSAISPASLGALAFAPGNAFGDLLYLGCDDGIIRKVDAAGTLSAFSPALGAAVQGLAFSDEQGFGQSLYALLGDGRVLRLDAAGNATPFVEGLLIEALANDVVRNDLEFAPGHDILYVSDARRAKVYGIQVDPPTAVDPKEPLPSRRLAKLLNFPNPFNPATTLHFELGTPQTVDLVIHDASGRRVRTLLAKEAMMAGPHELRWDGRDNQGQSVGSGVYYALLRSPETYQRRKLLLVK